MMRIISSLMAVMFVAGPAHSEGLPTLLSLRCTGQSKTQEFYPAVNKLHQFRDGTFDITIQLRDGSFYDVGSGDMLGDGCFYEKGTIGCSYDTTRYLSKDNMSERKQGIVMLNRFSGGIQLLHSIWYFEGKKSSSKSVNSMSKLQRDGTCEKIDIEPLF